MKFSFAIAVLSIISSASAFAPLSVDSSRGIHHFSESRNHFSESRKNQYDKENQEFMCGLVAAIDDIWNSNSIDFDNISLLNDYDKEVNEPLEKTTSILYHRGPDGMTCSSGLMGEKASKVRWSMGHTRLAIMDPSNRNADMPFELDFEVDGVTKHIKLAANGEIYNHDKIYRSMVENDGWTHERISGSDCEVIAHYFAKHGGPATAAKLDGMFAFVVFEEKDDGTVTAFAARDHVGIKPLYVGRSINADPSKGDASGYIFSSELKAMVGHVDPKSVINIPAGHYWTPEEGLVCFYNPEWLRNDNYAPWEQDGHKVTDDEIREAFKAAVEKRMMADVEYGFFLSGGVDSAVVSNVLMPLYKKAQQKSGGEFRRIPTYTVGMENSPDVMAAKAVVEALGGEKYIDHKIRTFTPDEVLDTVPKIIYHMETYEAELIRSSIPNWFLAEHAAKDVKMVLTGEGSDELFAGYLYFKDTNCAKQLQDELRRIYGMLGNINLHRTDRMTMAHGLEARVPFLDTEFTRLIMSIDPKEKMVCPEAVKNNARGREKTKLRELFEGPNEDGEAIPAPVLWRAKAMQCEGVGEDWVSILQKRVSSLVTDEEMANASVKFPINTPQTKEEYYYRRIFESHFSGMEHTINLWPGGGRAMGAPWKNDLYTREGLKNTSLLSHSLQKNRDTPSDATTSALGARGGALYPKSSRAFANSMFSMFGFGGSKKSHRNTSRFASPGVSESELAVEEAIAMATRFGYSEFEAWLTTGGDDRSLILDFGANKYHIRPQPININDIFRGSCTGNPPTSRGYDAAKKLFDEKIRGCSGNDLNVTLTKIFDEQRRRIAKNLDLPEGSEVILCPSGSDAEYIPVAIARALHPEKQIVNGITQLNEIGAGSEPASVGRYFSTHAPFLGEHSFDHLPGFENVRNFVLPAREADGNVIDASKLMADFTKSQIAQGNFPLVHGVFGGKTGVRDSKMPPSLDEGDTSIGIVDACQGRFSLDELKEWLKQDSIILFTSSKFFQAPPFSGAVILPQSIATKLKNKQCPEKMLDGKGLGAFLTHKELPSCLDGWREHLYDPRKNNVGLALRWEAGLAAMEALSTISDSERIKITDEWASRVKEIVDKNDLLSTFSVERSIVSIRISNNRGGWLNMAEARDVFRWMSKDLASVINGETEDERKILSIIAYTGQPVSVSENFAIIRIALGAESMISYSKDKNETLKQDSLIVNKLGLIAKYFDDLKKSGI